MSVTKAATKEVKTPLKSQQLQKQGEEERLSPTPNQMKKVIKRSRCLWRRSGGLWKRKSLGPEPKPAQAAVQEEVPIQKATKARRGSNATPELSAVPQEVLVA